MSLGANIRRYRKKLKLTQEQLAELLDVSVQNVSSWERDMYAPAAGKFGLLTEVLQVSAGKLLEADVRVGQWELRDEMFSTDNLYQQVLGYIAGQGLPQSMQALPQMMKLHEGQYRRGEGEVPYVHHPLMMAWHAISMGIGEDEVLAVVLLHGVRRNCDITPEQITCRLSKEVLQALRILYLPPDAPERKAAYYDGLRESHLAALVRCIDWCNKISTAAVGLPKEKLYDYIEDTEKYILPLLEYVQQNSIQYYRSVFLLKYQILSVTESLKRIL